MKIDAIYDIDRGEKSYYETAVWDKPIKIPTTYEGFEALITRVAAYWERPVSDFDDDVITTICGYIHSIERTENTITFETLAKVMWRSLGMKFSWLVQETIFAEKRAKVEAAKEEMKANGLAKKKQQKANKYSVKPNTNEAEAN